jgi:signal transduction histidine kinase
VINSERALILAPEGRDGLLAASILEGTGKTAKVCGSLPEMLQRIEEGAGVAVLTIEALQYTDLNPVSAWIERQPPWSDFPFVILSRRNMTPDQQPRLAGIKSLLGNVIVLDRPFHPTAFLNVVENALRARRRQYEARRYLNEISEGESRLRFLDTLGRETAASSDADQILSVTTKMLGRYMDVAICAYADMEPDEDHFTIRGDWSRDGLPSIVGYYRLADFGKRAVRNLRAGLPLILNDNATELTPHEASTFERLGIAATICMPLVKEGRLTALMAVHEQVPRVWKASELSLMTEVTHRSWAHIERVRSSAVVREQEKLFRVDLESKVAKRTQALEQSEKSLRTIIESSHLYAGLLTVDGIVEYANVTSLAGISAKREDVVGLPFWETPWFTGTPGVSETVKDAVSRVAAGDAVALDMTLDLPTGTRRFDFSMRPVKNSAGEVVAMVPEAIETTARYKAEQALQQAQKMEAIGNLTGGIAHDFNNLLMAVLGSLELLRKRLPEDPVLFRLLDNAVEGARRGSSLTDRMLAFARRQDLKSEHIALPQLVKGMMELLRRSLGPTVAVETRLSPHLPAVQTDANQLESALLNLAVNARDAMNGEGRIIISGQEGTVEEGHPRLAPGRYVALCVSDTGEGMDEATLSRATDPFFTTKGVGKGTGLGLSMVHGLAEQSGGTLILKSRPGRGTTAEIWLPVSKEEERKTTTEASIRPHPVAKKVEQRKLLILAVDDDALVLMNTVAMLEDLGHDVKAANSGKLALELAARHKPDLVITDQAMPNMTGSQLSIELRQVMPDLPIVLATGYAELPPGMDLGLPRLSKPFSQSDLEKIVNRATMPDPAPT